MKKTRTVVKRSGSKRKLAPRFGKEILIVLAVFIVASTWRIVLHEFTHDKRHAAIKKAAWKQYSPGGDQLSLMLPGEMGSENVDVPENLREKVEHISRYKYDDEQFQVTVWDMSYFAGIPTDIQQAAEGARRTLNELDSVEDYQDSITPITISGRPGRLMRGTFKRSDEEMKLDAVLLGDGPKLWLVINSYPASDSIAHSASKRILDSVKVD